MYLHPAISRDLSSARQAEDLSRAARHRWARAIRRSRIVRRSSRDRARPRLRRLIWRLVI
jgi:hypothetical protein